MMFINNTKATWVHAEVVENEVRYTLTQLSRACGADDAEIMALVEEGVVMTIEPTELLFDHFALVRARTALRLLHDLELNSHAAALVLDLLDEIDALRHELTKVRAQNPSFRAG
jgi:chaperone modulatory protein CbpM